MNQTTLPSRKAKAFWRWILTALTVLVGTLLAYDGSTIFYNANFRTIVSGEAYRSASVIILPARN
jgi:uncharacterized membrane protein